MILLNKLLIRKIGLYSNLIRLANRKHNQYFQNETNVTAIDKKLSKNALTNLRAYFAWIALIETP